MVGCPALSPVAAAHSTGNVLRICTAESNNEMKMAQVLFMPAGLIACFRPLTDASLFLLLYGVTAVYFR